MPASRLLIVGTPIGNLADLSARAIEALRRADVIAAEDTRTARALLTHLGLQRRLVSYFEGNEAQRTFSLLADLRQGKSVALISEAGMPLVSDPGARLVRACIEAGVILEVIPGPSAALVALVGSGLSADVFRFVGFLPRKGSERRERMKSLVKEPATVILFEAANRLATTLEELGRVLGNRRAVVARELTRLHEEFVRGTLAELGAKYADEPARGQVTVVVEGNAIPRQATVSDEFSAKVREALAAGMTPRDIYRLAVELRTSED